MTDQDRALKALKEVDFDWTMHVKSVWRDSSYDVDGLHQSARRQIIDELDRLKKTTEIFSPLGQALVGEGGAGKTHLIGTVRKYAFSQGIGFILVDMTDVHQFWETVLQGYISSLQENDAEGVPQYQSILNQLLLETRSPVPLKQLAPAPIPTLNTATKSILSSLVRKDRQRTIKFQDIIRALLLLNSDSFDAQNVGYNWLQGFNVDESEKEIFCFSRASLEPRSIVQGLSWLMSLKGPSVLALDQLDAVVAQYHLLANIENSGLTEEQETAKLIAQSIITELGRGLSALRDTTTKTLSLVSCLEASWTVIMNKTAISTSKDRFRDPILLAPILKGEIGKEIIRLRLQKAYQGAQFSPPYETYPFSPSFFKAANRQLPRKILQRCARHVEKCLAGNHILELHSFIKEIPPDRDPNPNDPRFEKLDKDFATAQSQITLSSVLDEKQEDRSLAAWLQTTCYALIAENPTSDDIDASWEKDFTGGAKYPLLHGRIRLVFRSEQEREKHFSLRALQRENAIAYQSRLKAAMTASGIDRKASSFRRLMIVRSHTVPGGAVTQKLTKAFREAGGSFGHPSEEEMRVMGALHHIRSQNIHGFEPWLRSRQPISRLLFVKDTVEWLFEGTQNSFQGKTDSSEDVEVHEDRRSVKPAKPSVNSFSLPIGTRLVARQAEEPIAIPLQDLTKHAVVLAGSGSGKTVLIKRIVEEAALLKIPAIVIDGANDLSQMSEQWETMPESWQDEDKQKAKRYHQTTEAIVIVWTPGRETANPLNLNPLPDFSALVHDHDELSQAIDMACASLQDVVAAGKSQTAKVKRGILRELLQYFARSGGGNLQDLAALMDDAPMEKISKYSNAQKRIEEMFDLLTAQLSTNPLLRQSGAPLDPAVLLGLERHSNKTRISILNFIGLPGLEQQQQFLNQLAMTLFTWIKKNPAPTDQPIRGLLVIDEAKDFVPSRGSTPCKESINRLVAQARKYGLGIVFATQAPKSIDHNIIANCSTQFYGRANSPAAIDVIRDQLAQRGGTGQDTSKLPRGQFYVFSESISPPIKISVPLCLSCHPATPPDEAEVIRHAQASKDTLNM